MRWNWMGVAFLGTLVALIPVLTSSTDSGETLFVAAIVFAAYWLPTITAWRRGHHNIGAIFVVNLFLGWTGLGWVIALAMAAGRVVPKQSVA